MTDVFRNRKSNFISLLSTDDESDFAIQQVFGFSFHTPLLSYAILSADLISFIKAKLFVINFPTSVYKLLARARSIN